MLPYQYLIILVLIMVYFLIKHLLTRRRVKKYGQRVYTIKMLPPEQKALGVPVEHLPNPYPPYGGTLRINDPLSDNSARYDWMDDRDDSSPDVDGCQFCDGAYQITNRQQTQPYMSYCLAMRTNFSNFVYQIEATLLKGQEIGVVFRQTPGYRFYYFFIRLDGTYGLKCSQGEERRSHLAQGTSHAIKGALNEPNVLAVIANGNIIDLYVNQQHLKSVVDNTYRSGRIGTATGIEARSSNQAVFKNVMLWTLEGSAVKDDVKASTR